MLAAAALRCIGGQMQCRLILDTPERRERSAKMRMVSRTRGRCQNVKGYAAPETQAAAEQARLLIEQTEALGEPG